MIRLLHIQETIGSGGVERLRLSLSKLIDKNSFQLKIICTNSGGQLKTEIENQGVEVIEIGKFSGIFDLKNHLKVQKIISNYKPHIIHGAVFEGVTMAAVNGFLKKVPVIIIEETSDPKNRSWLGNILMKLFCKLSDVVIGVSPGVIEYLEKKLNLPQRKIKLINNGVAIPRKIEANEIKTLKETLGIASNEIVIGSVGRMQLDEHKRFSDLIKAFAILCEKHSNLKLLLVGSGKELANYKKLAIELKIEKNIVFTGYQSDVAAYYSMMDVFTLVSGYEAFGLVLAEAMLSKLPIVATNVGGMKYIVEDSKTGFLVDRYNVNEIAQKLEQLCTDKKLRSQFGNNGYTKAICDYTEQRYVEEIILLYKNSLQKII